MTLVLSPGQRRRMIVVLGALTAVGPVATDLYLPAFPQVAADLGVSVDQVQLTLSASLLGLGIGQLLYGPISDRYGRRGPILVGTAVFSLACLGCAFAPNLAVLTGFRFVASLGGAAGIVVARAIVRDCFTGAQIARMLTAMVMVFSVAPVFAPLLGAAILQVTTWPWLFVAMAVFGILCLVGAWTLPESLAPQRRNDHGFVDAMRVYGRLTRDRDYRVAALLVGAAAVALFAYISASPGVFMDGFGMSSGAYGLLFGVVMVFLIAGGQVNIVLLRTRSVHVLLRRYTVVQLVGTAAILVAAVLGLGMWVLVVALIVAGMCFPGIQANATAEAMSPFPDNAASASALLGTVSMLLGGGVSALMAVTGFDAAIQMGAVMTAGALAAALLARSARMPAA